MNHQCHGDRLSIDGKDYYRCLRDGLLVPVPGNLWPYHCPNCFRDVATSDVPTLQCPTRLVTQYYHPGFRRWLPFEVPSPPEKAGGG